MRQFEHGTVTLSVSVFLRNRHTELQANPTRAPIDGAPLGEPFESWHYATSTDQQHRGVGCGPSEQFAAA